MPNFRKVTKGEKLLIEADAWNAMQEAAAAHRSSAGNRRTPFHGSDQINSAVVEVVNDTEFNQARFAVMGVRGSLIDPATNLLDFKNHITLKLDVPDEEIDFGKFVILLEAIPARTTDEDDGDVYSFGKAVVAGLVQCQINIVDEEHKFADITDGNTSMLTSTPEGSARIYWVQPGTGPKWGVVLLTGVDAKSCETT